MLVGLVVRILPGHTTGFLKILLVVCPALCSAMDDGDSCPWTSHVTPKGVQRK